ncbi:alpha/beta fold hydrolase [Nocardioides humilatus]|nr:alpha/beta fold hydrolase [Nocardioides humilatus]
MNSTEPQVTSSTRAGFPTYEAAPASAPGKAPVVLLHGAFADHESFRGWLGPLAAGGHHAIAPARRGRVGVGPERAEGLAFDDYVADTIAVLDTLDEPAILVGHSLGALVAQRLAEQGRARAIVLLAPAPPAMLTAQAVALPHFLPQMPRIMTGRPFVVGPAACSALALNRLPEADRPAVHQHLTHESGKVYRAAMFGTIKVDARKVTVPVFVAGGTDDRIIATSLTRKTAKHYGVEPRIIEGRGHWIIGEPGWEDLLAEVVAWVS